jgi:hypothetical protein
VNPPNGRPDPSDAARQAAAPRATALTARAPLSAGWKFGIGSAGILGAGYLDRPLGAALAAVAVIVALAIALVLLGAIMRGSDQTCDRIFRLLRWIVNRPEPPPPRQPPRLRTSACRPSA